MHRKLMGPQLAQPRLTANTNASCNTVQRKGFAHCLAVVRTASPGTITPQQSGPPATALGPADIQSAYKLPPTGGGQTVAIVDAFGDSSAENDLAVFRSQYGLPPCTTANGCFRKVDQTGGTNYPGDDPGWALETSLDLDAVSAACPACNILLVEGTDNSLNSLGVAVDEAVALGAKFVSNSYGAPEDSSELSFDQHYNHPGVAVTASGRAATGLPERHHHELPGQPGHRRSRRGRRPGQRSGHLRHPRADWLAAGGRH